MFNELKKMDDNLKKKEETKHQDEDVQRRLEMFRKIRHDMDQENREEKEAAY